MRTDKILGGLVAVFVCAFLLAECHNTNTGTVTIIPGGGTNGSGGSNVSRGVMKKEGSVIVNGVTFSVAAAQITHDESPADEALLQDGMTVQVRGSVSSDNTSGTAAKVNANSEMRGTISAKGVDSITLLNQQAFVDSRTVYTNVANFQGLTAGQWVEVHGIRDAQGRLLATRIEVLFAAAGPPADRLKGVVEAPFTGGNPPSLTFVVERAYGCHHTGNADIACRGCHQLG